jgi:type II secretory pathway component GspD/PulD (secretin)
MNRLLLALLFCAACATATPPPPAKAPLDLQIQVVKLENAAADDVAKALAKTLASPPASGVSCKVVAYPNQNVLVVSGTTAQIREVLEAVARLDVRPER